MKTILSPAMVLGVLLIAGSRPSLAESQHGHRGYSGPAYYDPFYKDEPPDFSSCAGAFCLLGD